MNPSLTIILATLNAGRTIERCLKSIAGQSFRDFELIVMDGVSSDDTLEKIEPFRNICSHIESSRDNGIYGAWNKALKKARGEWVMFVGADDYFPSATVLADLMAYASTVEAELVTVRNVEVDAKGERLKVYGEPWIWDRFRKFMNICHVGVLHRRSLFDRYGLFDEKFRIAGDYELLMRAGSKLVAVDFNEVVACCGNAGVSRSNMRKGIAEVLRIQSKYKSTPTVLSAIRYGVSYLRRQIL